MVLCLRVASADNNNVNSMIGNTVLVGREGGLVLTVEPTRPVE